MRTRFHLTLDSITIRIKDYIAAFQHALRLVLILQFLEINLFWEFLSRKLVSGLK